MNVAAEPDSCTPLETGKNTELVVSIVRTDAEFRNLEETWNLLAAEAGCSVFQTFQWTRTWWEHFGKGRKLYIVVFRDDAGVVGIAPMVEERMKFLGVRVATLLRFIYGKPSFYSDVVTAPGYEQKVYEALASHLRSAGNKWDIFDMPEVKEESRALKSFPSCLESSGIEVFTHQTGIYSQVPLPSVWDDFLKYIGGKPRHEFKRKTDRLNERFQVETEVIEKGDSDVADAVRKIADIHGRRWESLGYKNRYSDENEMSFLTRVSGRFAQSGLLRIMFMRIDGERVAGLLNFNFGNCVYCYHANALGSPEIMKYSPGILLHYSAIKKGIEEGYKGYDMMIGQEDYKFSDVKSVKSQVWQIRGISPGSVHRLRFKAYTGLEVARKGRIRLRDEYHVLKRYYVTTKPSASGMVKFTGSRLKTLWSYERSHFSKLFSGEGTSEEKKTGS